MATPGEEIEEILVDSYGEYEQACERIRQKNGYLLSEFGDWLAKSGVSGQTIRGHLSRIDLYINHFLLYEDAKEAADGVLDVGMFLGYWFIRKAGWASAASIRSNAASLKKFYTFLLEKGWVEAEEVQQLREAIKEQMPEWLATMDRYDDPSITDPMEIWGL